MSPLKQRHGYKATFAMQLLAILQGLRRKYAKVICLQQTEIGLSYILAYLS